MRILNCILQAGPPALHCYCTVVLRSCIVRPPVGHSSNHQYHCCQLTDNRTAFRIVIAFLRFSFDSPSYIKYWPEDGLLEPKYVTKLCTVDCILMLCLDLTNHFINLSRLPGRDIVGRIVEQR